MPRPVLAALGVGVNDVARMQTLIEAMRAFASEWACDQLTATYVTDAGELHALVVGRTYACVQNAHGETIAMWAG